MRRKMTEDKKNKTICSLFVGQHTYDVVQHMANWMTKHIRKRTTPYQFSKIWKDFEGSDGELSDKVPGVTEGEYWLDVLSFEEGTPDKLYNESVYGGADRFIAFNNNAYVDLVAIRGHPSGRDIALYVLKNEENVGDWTDQNTIEHLGEEYLKETE